jgi:MFS family permease
VSIAPAAASPPRRSITKWLILIVASIGFLFDTYELLMLPVIAGPALSELLQVPQNNPLVRDWVGRLLWMAALSGGVFGLLGGWLIDRLGRKTVMAASIIVYSISPLLAAFSTELWEFVLFRCITFIGVCVQFVAAITWLAELFPEKRSRELAIGWTQAFASVGGLLVTGAYRLSQDFGGQLPALPVSEPFNAHAAWRYALITGLIPGLLIAVLLPFVPESRVWLEKKRSGTLKRPHFAELFAPGLIRTTLVTTVLSACAYAAAFGALQLTPSQVVPGLREFAENRQALEPLRKEANALNLKLNKTAPGSEERKSLSKEVIANRKKQLPYDEPIQKKGTTAQFWQETGGLAGRVLLALLVVAVASRRLLLWLFQVPGLLLFPLTYFYLFRDQPDYFLYGVFLCGLVTVAQFSYLGEYLPKAFPVHLRGTGGSFATNVGGRMIGTSAAFLTSNLIAPLLPVEQPFQVAVAAAIVGGGVYLIGFIASFWLPEPKPDLES